MKKKDEFKLGYLNFKRNIVKSINPIIIIVIAILILNLMTSFLVGIKKGLSSSVIDNNNLKFISVTGKNNAQLTYNDMSIISKTDGVKSVFPRVTCFVGIRNDSQKGITTLLGVTNEALPYFSKGTSSFRNSNDIIINDSLSQFNINDKLKIAYSVKVAENSGMQQETDVNVLNKYKQTSILDIPDNVSLAPIEFVEELQAKFYQMTLDEYKQNIKPESFIVVTNDINKLIEVSNNIEKKGYTTNFSLKSSKELPMFSKVIIFVSSIIIVILLIFACININSVINQSLKNRYHEIGIMKALGFSKDNILNILIFEIILISLCSFLLSIIISIFLILGINSFILSSKITIASMEFSYVQILISFIVIVTVMLISSLNSILKASRLNPIDSIRRE